MTAIDREEYYDLWDTDTGNLIGFYATLVEALTAMVRIGDDDLTMESSLGSNGDITMRQLRAIIAQSVPEEANK